MYMSTGVMVRWLTGGMRVSPSSQQRLNGERGIAHIDVDEQERLRVPKGG